MHWIFCIKLSTIIKTIIYLATFIYYLSIAIAVNVQFIIPNKQKSRWLERKTKSALTENKCMQKFQNCIEHLIEMLGKMYLSKYIKRERERER